MVELGFFSLCLGLVFCIYSLFISIYSLFKPYIGLLSSARNSLIAVFLCVFLASLVLWNSIFLHDFSVKYVFNHSSQDMSPFYLFTSFWSALEGSHLLWTLIMSLVVTVALITVKKQNEVLYPSLCLAFSLALTFMLVLNVTYSTPLERYFPVGQFGKGMNALLQNPYMAIHPPMLFLGYCLLIVPFAYSFSALIHGTFPKDWLSTVRNWALLAWIFLSVAIFLGGKWAYVELGWAGYWAWDPVENSSFMPWLSLTAALHTLLITDKTGRLPRLLVFLFMLAFSLTFLGTFITRSGVISSVHSFAESNIGPSYLIWVVFLFSITCLLVFTKGNSLPGAGKENVWKISKESSLLFTNFFLLFLLALVFVGTILPLVVEAIRGVKISIQQPFFNAFAPWIGAGLVLLLGVGNIIRWKNGKIEDPVTMLLFPFIWAIAIALSLHFKKNLDNKSTLYFLIIIWTAGVLTLDLVYKLRNLRWNAKVFLKYNRPYFGAYIIHIGFLFAIAGFSGNYRGVSAETSLNLNEKAYFNGYEIKNLGLGYFKEYNAQYVVGKLEAIDVQTSEKEMVYPMRSKFSNNEQWFNEIGIKSTLWHDLYIVLASFDVNTQNVTLKFSWNPMVKFVWTSLVIMVIGALISISHRIRRRSIDIDSSGKIISEETDSSYIDILISSTKNENQSSKIEMKHIHSFGILLFCVFILCLGISGYASAQLNPKQTAPEPSKLLQQSNMSELSQKIQKNDKGDVIPLGVNPLIEDVAKELRCPTCQGISVLESGTLQSIAMRTEIENQLAEGKSKKEIIEYFKKSYGPWILREPDIKSPIGFLIWLIPVLGLIFGPIFILFMIKKSKVKNKNNEQKMLDEIEQYILNQKRN